MAAPRRADWIRLSFPPEITRELFGCNLEMEPGCEYANAPVTTALPAADDQLLFLQHLSTPEERHAHPQQSVESMLFGALKYNPGNAAT